MIHKASIGIYWLTDFTCGATGQLGTTYEYHYDYLVSALLSERVCILPVELLHSCGCIVNYWLNLYYSEYARYQAHYYYGGP